MIIFSDILQGLISEQKEIVAESTAVMDNSIIDSFIRNKKNSFLVSFPRTGSHWLRMIMELYFQRPSLVRVFYYPEVTNYLTLHTHDMDLCVERENIIYLYRDPVDTIYSQMNYYKEDIDNKERIVYWADLYGRHLDKWLYIESFTKKKTIVNYEGMKNDIVTEFRKITDHYSEKLDSIRLVNAATRITKEEVKRKTGHDIQVVQLKEEYNELRNEFKLFHGQQVWDSVLNGRSYLDKYFAHL